MKLNHRDGAYKINTTYSGLSSGGHLARHECLMAYVWIWILWPCMACHRTPSMASNAWSQYKPGRVCGVSATLHVTRHLSIFSTMPCAKAFSFLWPETCPSNLVAAWNAKTRHLDMACALSL
jgi:hypothetical protein